VSVNRLALYRKYRSAHFDDVLGQDHIVATLKSSLISGRASHAYLFSGPRGTGKTSVARLLAQGLNCLDETNRPCGTCALCITTGSANVDIIEIDAASNRGIDEIRELRDKISLAPSRGKFKVYIIDEVHMLTEPAFNALLKTLEEPPSHAVFILATTESHKIPATIVSRAQNFRFRPIDHAVLVNHLEHIAKAESIIIEPEAIELIATASNGGFRDAISLLDQLSAAGQDITAAAARATLGLMSKATLEQLAEFILSAKTNEALQLIASLSAEGTTAGQIAWQLLSYFRKLLTDPERAAVAVSAIDALMTVAKSPWPDLALETAIVRSQLPEVAVVVTNSQPAVNATPNAVPTAQKVADKPVPSQAPAQSGELWLKSLVRIKSQNNSLYAVLRSCSVSFSADAVLVSCRFRFHRDRLLEPKFRQIIEQAAETAFGTPMRIVVQIENMNMAPAEPAPTTELVSSALEILGGEVLDG
jgi:DNA polymerase III subunit gamma/tau